MIFLRKFMVRIFYALTISNEEEEDDDESFYGRILQFFSLVDDGIVFEGNWRFPYLLRRTSLELELRDGCKFEKVSQQFLIKS